MSNPPRAGCATSVARKKSLKEALTGTWQDGRVAAMPSTSSFPLVDRIVGGTLRGELARRRAAGESYAVIARWLAVEHQVDLTGETVRQWCRTLGIEKAA